jgi:hypothetical protein
LNSRDGGRGDDPSVAHRPTLEEGGPEVVQPGSEPADLGVPPPPDQTGE